VEKFLTQKFVPSVNLLGGTQGSLADYGLSKRSFTYYYLAKVEQAENSVKDWLSNCLNTMRKVLGMYAKSCDRSSRGD
jgi:C1A family cysteine protease